MNRSLFIALACAVCCGAAPLSWAQGASVDGKAASPAAAKVVLPPGVTEEMLAPPPMPAFMLKKPAKPLTLDEMVGQARAAEQQAAVKPAKTASAAPEAGSKPNK